MKNYITIKSLILAAWVAMCIMVAHAAPNVSQGKLQFRHYTTEEGVPSDCIRDIVQDSAGYMWFATDGGVTRFDGYNFKNYPLQPSETGQEDNFASSLSNNEAGLWVGTDSHLYHFDPKMDKFVKYPIYDTEGKELEGAIRQIQMDADGNLWIVMYSRGILRISHPESERHTTHFYPFPQTNKYVGAVLVDSRGDIWAVSHLGNGGLYRLHKDTNKFENVPILINGAEHPVHAISMTEDADNSLWLGTWDGALIRYNPITKEGQEFFAPREEMSHIHSLTPMADGWLMIGSDGGLHVVNTNNGKIYDFHKDELDSSSLSDQFIYPIVVDSEGGVWIGTYYGGINYLSPNLKAFDKHQHSQYVNSVSGKVISGFAEDKDGDIYIASDDGGLSCYDPAKNTFRQIELSRSGHDNLHALMVDGDDLWVGSYGDGVYRYNMKHGTVESIPTEEGRSSYAMYRDKQGNLWVATDRWLHRYDAQSRKLVPVRELNALIIDMEEDHDGRLWICTQGDGLYRYNPLKNDWRNYRYNNGNGTIPHNHVNAVAVDNKNNVWVATVAGLAKYDPEKGVFNLDERAKVFGSVAAIVEDKNALWMTTNMGLVKYIPDVEVQVFTRLDGLCSTQFLPNSMLKASNGKIYVGTRDGFTSFFPHQIRLNEAVPPVVITNIEIDNRSLPCISCDMEGNQSQDGKVIMHPDDHSLSIDFASLSYVNPHKNQYKYRLDGFDTDWVLAGGNNHVFYTNLEPGKYTFRVKGSNGDNVWNEEESKITIEVLAPWYQTWPMKLLYALMLITVVLLVIYLYTKRAERRHHDEIQSMKASKEMELYEAKMSFFTTVAHEIRTPVSLIIGPLEKLMHSPEKLPKNVNADLSIIERNSQRLLFLVNQLLDFKKVEESGPRATFTTCDVAALMHEVVDRFRPTLEQKGITLIVDCKVPETFAADVDAEQMTKLISNLMNNARKFTRDLISVTLDMVPGEDKFAISVADNGIGLSKEDQRKIFMPFYQVENVDSKGGTGLGLSIVHNVVEAHDGSIVVDSELGHGTTFIATFPIHQESVVVAKKSEVKQDSEKAVEPAKLDNTKVRLLVVEDNDELRSFIASSFADHYDVVTASDGEEAESKLRECEVSLIISDWMMPHKDGVQLLRDVREDKNYSHIPFVLLTAKTDNRSIIEGLNCGADAYVEKPFSMQVLHARIANLMNMREMLRRKYSQTPLEPIESLAPHNVDSEFLTQLTGIIEENFSNPDLDVDFLAQKMDMSRSSLYAKIRSLVDVTPNDLIRITRLKNAARLLADGKYRINEVCYMVGFNSSSYFAKCFQKQFNMTPSEFVANR